MKTRKLKAHRTQATTLYTQYGLMDVVWHIPHVTSDLRATNTTPTNKTHRPNPRNTRASSPPIAYHRNSHPIHTLKQATEAEVGRLGEWIAPCSLRYNWKGNRYHIQATSHAMLIPYVFPPKTPTVLPA